MQQVKLFHDTEENIHNLEEINTWLSKSGGEVVSIQGNIAPQTVMGHGETTKIAFAQEGTGRRMPPATSSCWSCTRTGAAVAGDSQGYRHGPPLKTLSRLSMSNVSGKQAVVVEVHVAARARGARSAGEDAEEVIDVRGIRVEPVAVEVDEHHTSGRTRRPR